MATEYLLQVEPTRIEEEVIMEASVALPLNSSLLEDLRNVVFKLRAFTESVDEEMGLGIELGMQRAADMIEHIINRHEQPGE